MTCNSPLKANILHNILKYSKEVVFFFGYAQRFYQHGNSVLADMNILRSITKPML